MIFDRFFSIGGHINGWEGGQTQNKVDRDLWTTVLELISSNMDISWSNIALWFLYIYLHVYLYLTLFFWSLFPVFFLSIQRSPTAISSDVYRKITRQNPDLVHREGDRKKSKGRDGQSPAPSPRPKRPTGHPPEGPDSDPIRICAARELIKKIQIVTLNDDLGFYRPANWVNPTALKIIQPTCQISNPENRFIWRWRQRSGNVPKLCFLRLAIESRGVPSSNV